MRTGTSTVIVQYPRAISYAEDARIEEVQLG
jgi:hypothetical protein